MRQVAIAGVGYTPLTKNSGRSVLSLATEAAKNAVEDAGLPLAQVDGIGSFMVLNDSVSCGALGTALALPELRWTLEFQHGGQSPCHVVGLAAMAVACGYAENVIVFRALLASLHGHDVVAFHLAEHGESGSSLVSGVFGDGGW